MALPYTSGEKIWAGNARNGPHAMLPKKSMPHNATASSIWLTCCGEPSRTTNGASPIKQTTIMILRLPWNTVSDI
jgi:hypothetical protein